MTKGTTAMKKLSLGMAERKKLGRPLTRGAVMRHNPQPIQPFWQVPESTMRDVVNPDRPD